MYIQNYFNEFTIVCNNSTKLQIKVVLKKRKSHPKALKIELVMTTKARIVRDWFIHSLYPINVNHPYVTANVDRRF